MSRTFQKIPTDLKLRILQVVPRYAPAWAYGGGVRITYELAKQWVSQGHHVTVFTSNEGNSVSNLLPSHEIIDGIHIERFPVASHYLAKRFPFIFFRPRGLRRALKERCKEFDVIHLAESRGPHNRWVLRDSADRQVPVVWSAYGGLASGLGVRKFYRWGHDKLYRTSGLVGSASCMIAQTEHEAKIFRSFGATEGRIANLPLAVSRDDINLGLSQIGGSFRKKHGIDKDAELIVFVGRLHWTKGLQLLIPAFADVVLERPNARLAIVGWNQGFENEARRLVHEYDLARSVIFTGPVFGADRFSVYRDADVFTLTPGVYEETSLAALEACSVGTPCVITFQCEIPGLVSAQAGLMVEYQREQVASALLRILAEGGRNTWGKRAQQLVNTHFTSDIVASKHLDLFASVLRSSSSTLHGKSYE